MAVEHAKDSERISLTGWTWCLLAVTVGINVGFLCAQGLPQPSMPQNGTLADSPALLKARNAASASPSSAAARYDLARVLQRENQPAESLRIFTGSRQKTDNSVR